MPRLIMTFRCALWCAGLLLFISVAPAWSANGNNSDNPFEVAIPVASQSSSERAKAAGLGLRKVILRISGSQAAVESDALSEVYSNAQHYIDQFRYEPYSPPPNAKTLADATELLVMTFPQREIEQLLRKAGLPYWPTNRPKLLVWLVENTSNDGKVLVNDRDMELMAGLFKGARERGLQIQLPLLDLEDRLALPAKQLWQLDDDAILAASERYDADTILVGRYSQTSRGTWLSTWQFFHRGVSREYDYRSDTGLELGSEVIDPVADYLAGRYAISLQENTSPELVVQLAGITSFGDYHQALNYLSNLAMVSSVQLRAVRGDTLLLYVNSDGGQDSLRNFLTLDRKLQPATQPALEVDTPPWLQMEEGTPERPLQYVWQRF